MASDAQLTIRFDLDTLEGREAMDLFLSGPELLQAVRDVDAWLRSQLKYTEQPDDVRAAYQAVRDRIRDELPSRLRETL